MNALNVPLFSSTVGDLPPLPALLGQAGVALNAPFAQTAITTVGNGTLTAAALVGGVVNRSGPTGAYTDTFDTIANIVAALPGGFVAGSSFRVSIKNTTIYPQTLSAGSTGIVLPATVLIGPWQETTYAFTFGGTAAAPTLAGVHITTQTLAESPSVGTPQITNLNTVGAATILASTGAFANGIVIRGGSQANAAFTDTTDTATAIIAADPGLANKISTTKLWYYQNNTNAIATLAGGTGVTLADTVGANCSALYQINYTAAATLVFTLVSKTAAPTAPNGTFTANGASAVTVADTRVTANSVIIPSLKTVGGTVGAIPAPKTVTPGTGFTIAGTVSDTSVYNYIIIN